MRQIIHIFGLLYLWAFVFMKEKAKTCKKNIMYLFIYCGLYILYNSDLLEKTLNKLFFKGKMIFFNSFTIILLHSKMTLLTLKANNHLLWSRVFLDILCFLP